MARKKITIQATAPVTLLFSAICILVFILQHATPLQVVETIFTVGGNASSSTPFNRTSIQDYITIITHVFGNTTWQHLALSTLSILLLGPSIEEAYGKGLLILMLSITAFITGVLSTLFVSTQISGSQGIVILFLIVSILSHAKTKSIPLSILFASLLYVVSIFIDSETPSISEKIIPCLGALCGSTFAFIDFFEQTKPVPRKKRTPQ